MIHSKLRIAAPLISMLKIIESPNKLAFSKNNSSKLAFTGSNSSKPASGRTNNNNEVDVFDDGNIKYTKKSEKSKALKLFKSGKSKSKNLAKSKKLSKYGNLSNFDAKKAKLNILIFDAKKSLITYN